MRTLAPRSGVKSTGKASRYSVVKIIGRGSFGTAYLVRRKADSFLYVMKKLVLEQLGQRERAEAMNECAVLTKLRNHPNIVRVIEHFIDDGRLCIVMEYADGGDLAKRIEAQVASKSNFLEELVINWFVQICLALKHAHDRKILHRDLKPQNIFLTAKNSVRLGDFGISKVLSNTLSVASTCVGTPLYLAPELCEGKEYDSKSDVWSLGAILYELCALQPPFTANTMPALVMRICGNDPPPLASEISEPTRTLADRLLDKDPRQRPRVHDILKEPHIHARIEAFLNPEDLLEEFSHTIIHADPFMANGDGAARRERDPTSSRSLDAKVPAATVFGRGRGGTKPPGGIGIGGGPSAAVSRRSPGGSGATIGVRKAGAQRGMRPSSPAGEREDVSRAEDPTQRALRLREAGEKREALREQIRRDRQLKQSARRQESGEHTVFQLILGGMAKDAAAGATPAPAVPAAEQPRRGATGSDADIVEVAVGGGDAHVRLALQSAHPGTRLLTDAQRQVAQDSLARRQQEVVAQIQSSQVKGEAGRAMLNEAHRELLEIARLRSATNMPYVLVRTDPKAATNGDVIAGGGGGCVVSSVPSEQIAVIDELPDDEEADLEEEIDDDDLALERGGAGGGQCAPAEHLQFARTLRVDGTIRMEHATMRQGIGSRSKASAQPPSFVPEAVAWEVAGDAHAPLPPAAACGGTGGIAFHVMLNAPPSGKTQQAHLHGEEAPPPLLNASSDSHPLPSTLTMPAQLFGAGTPLSKKVQKLRSHLVEQLGGQATFDRIYGYVLREESGEHLSGERDQILSVMAEQGQRELLPFVHTLLYLEEALGAQ